MSCRRVDALLGLAREDDDAAGLGDLQRIRERAAIGPQPLQRLGLAHAEEEVA